MRRVDYSRRYPEILLDCRSIGCEQCCYNTEMLLSEEDVERIEALGFNRQEFAVYDGRSHTYRLRNVGGRCYFLKPGKGCIIYNKRPLGCRLYPVICIEGVGLAVDLYCPLAVKAYRILENNEELVCEISSTISRLFKIRCPPRLAGFVDVHE